MSKTPTERNRAVVKETPEPEEEVMSMEDDRIAREEERKEREVMRETARQERIERRAGSTADFRARAAAIQHRLDAKHQPES